MKEKLLKDIRLAYDSTSNSCKMVTLENYYNTVQGIDEESINYEWYYKQLEDFGFKAV